MVSSVIGETAMKVCAVICEYNPFHLGHAYLLSKMKKRGAVLALMSGSFTQRGEPAVVSKYERARAALISGADLVLELPFPYAASRADSFAAAGVRLLSWLGCVDELCFGSETGDAASLSAAALRVGSDEFLSVLASRLSQGHEVSYRRAFAEVYRQMFGTDIFRGSNDILAVSYLSEIEKQGASMLPVAIRRVGEAYDGRGKGFSSASSVRKMLQEGDFESVRQSVPPGMAEILEAASREGRLAEEKRLYPLFAALVRSGREVFSEAPDMTDELAARLRRSAYRAKSMEELLTLAETKRYSPSRLRRAVLYALLHVEKTDFSGVSYTSVLAANATGREILASIRKTARTEIVTKPADYIRCTEKTRRAFELCARADSVWELLCENPRDGGAMLREHPVML